MTLSKEELEFALGCAKSYYYESSESDYPNNNDKINEIRYRDLENALLVDNLEIEGYEKSEWIKFDPNNPKTFPPELTRVQVFDKESGDILTAKYDYDSNEWSLSWCMITHWRTLPKPPQEETK